MTHLLCLAAAMAAGPHVVRVESADHVVPLVELYTSEGCSSCPPADAYLETLGDASRGLTVLVPLSFHVTYWDYIGWRDRFGDRSFNSRQRAYAERPKAEQVYTPQFVVNGGRTQASAVGLGPHLASLRRDRARVRIDLEASWDAVERRLEIVATARPADDLPGEPLRLHVALFERHLSTDVRLGENQGRRLEHDFVVRAFPEPAPLAEDGVRLSFETDVPKDWKARDLGAAAFVQGERSLTVLQAVALTLVKPR